MGADFGAGARVAGLPASLAIAGPVVGSRCRATNLPWHVDGPALAAAAGLGRVLLLNDLEAVAWGVPGLGAADLAEIQAGDPTATGNACVVAAGTGLGQGGLFWDGQTHRPFATEGGHADFAPADALDWALAAHLRARFGRVSWERVASGLGIGNLYGFLAETRGTAHPPAVAAALAAGTDLTAAVADAAAAGCPVSTEALHWFARLLGREAGNTALKHMALAGVYLGGGIAPRHLDLLRSGGFLEAFLDKGRMRELLERIPVRVILNEQTPLIGAARAYAALPAAAG